jgi:biotin operon repressor
VNFSSHTLQEGASLTLYHRIIEVLRASPLPLRRYEIAYKLDTSRDAIWEPLKKLIDEGIVVRYGNSVFYKLAETTVATPSSSNR